jgi:hypothetical protein
MVTWNGAKGNPASYQPGTKRPQATRAIAYTAAMTSIADLRKSYERE